MKKLWIGSGIVVGVCLLAIVLSYALRGDPAPLRVSTYETTLSPSASSVPFVVVNLTQTETGFFQSYELQWEKDGTWVPLPGTSGNGQELLVGAEDYQRVTLDLEPFGTLAEGRYRICLRDTNGRKYTSNVFTLDDVSAVDVPGAWEEAVQGGVDGSEVEVDVWDACVLMASPLADEGLVQVELFVPWKEQDEEPLVQVGLQRYTAATGVWAVQQTTRYEVPLSAGYSMFTLPLEGTGLYRVYLYLAPADRMLYSNAFDV